MINILDTNPWLIAGFLTVSRAGLWGTLSSSKMVQGLWSYMKVEYAIGAQQIGKSFTDLSSRYTKSL